MANPQRKKVGVGWAKTSQDGTKKYVSIVINGGLSPDINLVMFTNGFKEGENSPDFILYLNAPRDPAAAAVAKAEAKAQETGFPGEAAGGDDDIPY